MSLIGIPSDLTDPNIPSNVLASKQFQTLLELLGEGEIEGFPSATGSKGSTEYNTSALKDVFLNGTQVLQQAAGTSPTDEDFNFQNVSFEPRFGTSDQTAIQAITELESEFTVSQTVTTSSPVSVSITNTSVNAVRVTIAFNACTSMSSGLFLKSSQFHLLGLPSASGPSASSSLSVGGLKSSLKRSDGL